jgi:hypothetical protein
MHAIFALLLLTACPAYEGPIDVILVDMDETAVVSWSLDGSDFAPCENGTTNPEATVGCGDYGVGDPGLYTIRVEWNEVRVDKTVELEKDRDYQANAEVVFEAGEFEG